MKRLVDVLVSCVALLALSPVIALVAITVRISLGAPVIFKQQRIGLHGQLFEVWKFRSMLIAADENGKSLSDSRRVTPFGVKLRSTSLDELPTMINVLRGDMSLVGPRPLLPEYLKLYTEEQARRHSVKPGITGWAQINGRNTLSWEEKFRYDIWYVDNYCLLLDIQILYRTLAKVIRREGINSNEDVTMSKFKGSNRSDDSP